MGGGQVLRVFDRAADFALAVEALGNRFAAGGGDAGQVVVAAGGGDGTCGGVWLNRMASVRHRRAHKRLGGRACALT